MLVLCEGGGGCVLWDCGLETRGAIIQGPHKFESASAIPALSVGQA